MTPGWVLRCLLVHIAALSAAAAQAAWVADAAADALVAADAAPKVLDRALRVDPQAQQRNLDLLLQARQVPDAAALMQRLPSGTRMRRPVLPQDIEAVQTPGVPPPPPMLGLRANEDERAAAMLSRREWRATGPGGSVGGAAYGAGAGGGPNLDSPSGATRGRSGVMLEELHPDLRDIALFVVENRFSLLGGLALLALVVAGAQGFMRRR